MISDSDGRMAIVPRLLVARFVRNQRGVPARTPKQPAMPPGLSVVMTAHNEQRTIEGCLAQFDGLADEIVVVDAASSDRTAAIASQYTPRVITASNNPMLEINKNIAMAAAAYRWVLVLDPDERISASLARQLREVVERDDGLFAGYFMPRRNYILGRWIRTMGMYPGAQLRLVRNGEGRFSETEHHLPMSVDGPIGYLSGDLVHLSDETVSDIIEKRTRYADFAARQMYARGVTFRARRLLLEPLRTFLRQYLLLGGFLEGVRGLIYAALSAYGGFLRYARLWELQRPWRSP